MDTVRIEVDNVEINYHNATPDDTLTYTVQLEHQFSVGHHQIDVLAISAASGGKPLLHTFEIEAVVIKDLFASNVPQIAQFAVFNVTFTNLAANFYERNHFHHNSQLFALHIIFFSLH